MPATSSLVIAAAPAASSAARPAKASNARSKLISSKCSLRPQFSSAFSGAPIVQAKPSPTASRMAATPARASLGEIGATLPDSYTDMGPGEKKGRRAGILMHPTSLPGDFGTGEMGAESFAFVDWLVSAGMQLWQVLPLVPPDDEYWSPYSGKDANCGNTLLISLESLVADGLLAKGDLPAALPVADADFGAVAALKAPLLKKAAQALLNSKSLRAEFEAFKADPLVMKWLPEASLFSAIAVCNPDGQMKAWWEWPADLKLRDPDTLAAQRKEHADYINEFEALQFLFDRQWRALKKYANDRGVKIIGDMPIYVGGHSADVWANRTLFELDSNGDPQEVSGVPPDAFSDDGQLWGSPLYNWRAHEEENYAWWSVRLGRANELYDETRIDHFRALAGYWAIPADSETAKNGVWKVGPGKSFFDKISANLGGFTMIAEDLGVITPDVVKLREDIDAPGMLVLQFAWGGGGTNVHLPHNAYPNSVMYPGTHDNETTMGWFKSADAGTKELVTSYLGVDGSDLAWDFIRSGFGSVSKTCIVSMQDVMSLDNSARMNTPGKAAGNWGWRIGGAGVWGDLEKEAALLKEYSGMFDRPFPKVDPPPVVEEASKSGAEAEEGKGIFGKIKSLFGK